jgi:NADH-quinone oxidoreductase subunit A
MIVDDSLMIEWLPVMILIGAAGIFVAINSILSNLLGEDRPLYSKLSPYESGNEPEHPAQQNISIHYGLVAVLFILFDIEVIFMYPWAMTIAESKVVWAPMGTIGLFVTILAVGYFYAWREGVFEWT